MTSTGTNPVVFSLLEECLTKQLDINCPQIDKL